MWYYVPSTSAAVTEDSNSECDSPVSPPEPWLTLSGMPTRRPYSWRGWKNRSWIRLLSGLTSPPSTLAHGLAEWISSLPVSPANHSVRPVSNEVLMTSDGSGRTSPGSLLTWDADSSSWKTSPDLFGQVSLTSSPILPKSGSMRSGVCTPRPRLAHHTNENESGSWPTPTASDPEGNGFRSGNRSTEPKLAGAAQLFRRPKAWPTPTGMDSVSSGGSKPSNVTLTDAAVRQRPTPRVSMGYTANDAASANPNAGGDGLVSVAKSWPTPQARDCKGVTGENRKSENLPDALTPPPRDDADGWAEWIAEGGPEPAVRRYTDGRPPGLADALHAGGNGLLPTVAARALIELSHRAGVNLWP